MELKELRRNWNQFGEQDPMWAILTEAEKKDGRWNHDEFFATGREQVEKLMQTLRNRRLDPPRGVALDVGCGIGRNTQAFAEHFARVDGVDIAPSMISLANEENRHGDRVAYRVVEGDTLSHVPSASVDLVWCFIVLHHMRPDYQAGYIAEFVRVLSPKGVAAFYTLNVRKGWRHRVKAWLPALVVPFVQRAYRFLMRPPVALPASGPSMETYVFPDRKVRRVIRRAGGRVRFTTPHNVSGSGYRAATYYVTR